MRQAYPKPKTTPFHTLRPSYRAEQQTSSKVSEAIYLKAKAIHDHMLQAILPYLHETFDPHHVYFSYPPSLWLERFVHRHQVGKEMVHCLFAPLCEEDGTPWWMMSLIEKDELVSITPEKFKAMEEALEQKYLEERRILIHHMRNAHCAIKELALEHQLSPKDIYRELNYYAAQTEKQQNIR